MKFIDLKDAKSMPPIRDLTPEERAALVAQYKSELDLAEAERDYRDMIENGGVDADELLRELEEIHKQAKQSR